MTSVRSDRPDASALDDYNIFDPDHARLKWSYFKDSQEQCPVRFTSSNGGLWLVTRYDDVRTVLNDWQTFSSVDAPVVKAAPSTPKLFPLQSDPPIHTDVRDLLNPLFSRTAVRGYEDSMRRAARASIAQWIECGSVDILSEFASPYIGSLLTEIIFAGMAEDDMLHARALVLASSEHASEAIFAEIGQTAERYLTTARELGLSDDTVVGRLLGAEIGGRAITDEQVVGALSLLLLGGLDTTRSAIGNITFHVATTPGLEARLRYKQWVRRDMDEFLRLDAPVPCMARTVTRDVELGGVQLRAGERVQIHYDAANRDASRFERADNLVFDEARPGHLSFGSGVHRCIGSNLARLQIEVAFDELFAQIKDIRLAEGAEPVWVGGLGNSLNAVPIEFDVVG